MTTPKAADRPTLVSALLSNILSARPAELSDWELRILTIAVQFMLNALLAEMCRKGAAENLDPSVGWKALNPTMYAAAAEYAVAAAIAIENPLRELRTKLGEVKP